MSRVATLIVNPAAGRIRLFAAQVPAMTALLEQAGYCCRIVYTTPEPHSARELARQALSSALILACGGDGTVHDVVQGVAHSGVPLGVLPLGTANALARNLQLPLAPFAALARLLTYRPQTIPLGELSNASATASGTRLFTVMAGCGPDGALAHTMPSALKQRLGRTAYYAHAARLFATRRWPSFQVEYLLPGDSIWHTTRASAMLVSRVPDLGGLFSGLTRQAHLHDPCLHVQLVSAPGHIALPAWFALSRLHLPNPLLTTLDVAELRCTPLAATPIHAQADAEPAGTLPLRVRILPAALTLLMPVKARPNL